MDHHETINSKSNTKMPVQILLMMIVLRVYVSHTLCGVKILLGFDLAIGRMIKMAQRTLSLATAMPILKINLSGSCITSGEQQRYSKIAVIRHTD